MFIPGARKHARRARPTLCRHCSKPLPTTGRGWNHRYYCSRECRDSIDPGLPHGNPHGRDSTLLPVDFDDE
jgi:hypothetical protein